MMVHLVNTRQIKCFKAPAGYVVPQEQEKINAARTDKEFLDRLLFKLNASFTVETYEKGFAMFVTDRETWGRVGHINDDDYSQCCAEAIMAKKFVKSLVKYTNSPPFIATFIEKNEQCRDLIADHFAVLLEILHNQGPIDWQKSELAAAFWERHEKVLEERCSASTDDACIYIKTPLTRPTSLPPKTARKPVPITLFGEEVFEWPKTFRKRVLEGFTKMGSSSLFPHKFIFDLCKVLGTDMCLEGVHGELYDEKGAPLGGSGIVFVFSMLSWEWLMSSRWNYPYDVDSNEYCGEKGIEAFKAPRFDAPPLLRAFSPSAEEDEEDQDVASNENDKEEGELTESSGDEGEASQARRARWTKEEEKKKRPNPVELQDGILFSLFKNVVERLEVPKSLLPPLMVGTPADKKQVVFKIATLMKEVRNWEFKAEGEAAWLKPEWQDEVRAFWKKNATICERATAGRDRPKTTPRPSVSKAKPTVSQKRPPVATATVPTVPKSTVSDPAAQPSPGGGVKRKNKKVKVSRGYIPPKRVLETAEEEANEDDGTLNTIFPDDRVKVSVVLKEIEQSSSSSENLRNARRFFHTLLGKGFEMKLEQQLTGEDDQPEVDVRLSEKGGGEAFSTRYWHGKTSDTGILDGTLGHVLAEFKKLGFVSTEVFDAISATSKMEVTDEMLQPTVSSLQKSNPS